MCSYCFQLRKYNQCAFFLCPKRLMLLNSDHVVVVAVAVVVAVVVAFLLFSGKSVLLRIKC